MKFKTNIAIIFTMLSISTMVYPTTLNIYYKVFAQSNLLGSSNGGFMSNLLNNFNNLLGNPGSNINPPQTTPQTTSSTTSDNLFGGL